MPIELEQFEGAKDGSILSVSPNQVGDNAGVYLQDALLHKPGEIWRRGPQRLVSNFSSGVNASYHPGQALLSTFDISGNFRILLSTFFAGATPTMLVMNTALNAFTDIAVPIFANSGIIASSQGINGGALIGTSQ